MSSTKVGSGSGQAEGKSAAVSAGFTGQTIKGEVEQKAAAPRRALGNRGSAFVTNYGRRSVKAYPVNEVDLRTMGTLAYLATFAFSIGTGALGLAFDISKDLSLTPDVNAEKLGMWTGIQWSAIAFTAIFYALGLIILVVRGSNIRQIKEDTTFDGE